MTERPITTAIRILAGLVFTAGACRAWSAPPPAGVPYISRVLLDHTLTPHRALVHRIDAATITWTDERQLLHTHPASEYLAMLPGDGPTGWVDSSSLHRLGLVDGQQIPGVPGATPDAPDPPVEWIAEFGTFAIPLERVSTLVGPGVAAPPPTSSGDDTAHLRNGDTLTGFVVSMGRSIEIETDTGVRDIPLDLVAWVRLASPPEAPGRSLLWLADGSVIAVRTLDQASPESLRVRLSGLGDGASEQDTPGSESGGGEASFPLAAVRALAFEPGRVVALSGLLEPRTASDRPWTPAVLVGDASDEPLGAADVTLPSPMRATWEIPASASRLACGATLPERGRVWGDGELVIALEQDGAVVELSRTRLHGGMPRAQLNLELPAPADPRRARRLVVELVEGPSGPAQDAVVLERPLLLLGS